MTQHSALVVVVLALAIQLGREQVQRAGAAESKPKTFQVRGTIEEIKSDGRTVIIDHESIPNFMDAMSMPFRVKATNELAGLRRGDVVRFRLSVTESESWIDQISRIGPSTNGLATPSLTSTNQAPPPTANIVEGLGSYTFINEFGRPMNFRDYRGQTIALTFFFTRCPIPDYCPRLTKNFLAASRKLDALPNAPTNWHLFSISFDAEVDTPEVLRAYARGYGYDSNRWTFLTASPQTISAVARNFGFRFQKEGGAFNHEFLTVVLDARGRWQAGWPIGGDTSDMLVEELIKGASARNDPKESP